MVCPRPQQRYEQEPSPLEILTLHSRPIVPGWSVILSAVQKS